jgi:hypothetical protein
MDNYLEQCRRYGGGDDNLPLWTDIRSVLERRADAGWYFEVATTAAPDPEAMWCFGLDGASRLVVTVWEGQVALYDHDNERDALLADAEALARLCEEHEEEHSGFTPLQLRLMEHLLHVHLSEWSGDTEP